jgi:16S rRNA (guanine(966)-N(2))-methyltransferase RsmD
VSQPRIIAGTARGIRLDPVPGESTRPITDRVKEALFNILSSDIVDASFLDLFGGTGSVGIEALSRGAKHCLFLEINPKAMSTLKNNLVKTKTNENARVLHADALKYLSMPASNQFDYVYIAPPQYKDLWLDAIQRLDGNISLLSEDGWAIVQIHPIEYRKLELENLVEFDQRKYGSTLLVFYERCEMNSPTASL